MGKENGGGLFAPSNTTGSGDALRTECLKHIFDPVRDYLDGLRWDGVPRVDRWLIDYCGAEDTPLNRAFGRKVLMAAVRRVRRPGCKFDYVLVLEGPQGIGKSTMLRILAGDENFSDSEILGDEKREQQEAVQGVWLYEISELEGMRKADTTHIKLFISKTHDRHAPHTAASALTAPAAASSSQPLTKPATSATAPATVASGRSRSFVSTSPPSPAIGINSGPRLLS